MDLLRQVLIRLPLQKLIDLRFPAEEFVRLRSRAVNRLTDDELDAYLLMMPRNSLLDRYTYLCQMQGEPSRDGIIEDCLQQSRAAFVGDSQTYDQLCRKIHYRPDLDVALRSGVPEIQAWALALSRNIFDISDPESIDWQPRFEEQGPSLLAFYKSSQTPMVVNTTSAYLIGYLHHDNPGRWINSNSQNIMTSYWSGYFRSEMLNPRPTFQPEEILSLIPDYAFQICLHSGYFSPRLMKMVPGNVIYNAFAFVRIDWIGKLNADYPGNFIIIDDEIHINRDLVERARRMISLVERRYPHQKGYLIQLRILCGLPVDLTNLTNIYEGAIGRLMKSVAHPQLTVDQTRSSTNRHQSL